MKKTQIMMLLAALIIALSGCAAENNTVRESAVADSVGTSSEALKVLETVPDISDSAVLFSAAQPLNAIISAANSIMI